MRANWPKHGPFLLAILFTSATVAVPLFGSTQLVTNLDDDGPGSLRQQIAAARSGDTISFAVRGTIVLTNGELLINKNLRIAGPGATNLALSAASQSRVLAIGSNIMVNLSDLTIANGHAPNGAAGTSNSPVAGNGSDGGGIYNAGFLTLNQCVLSNCAAGNGGDSLATHPDDINAVSWVGGRGGRGGAIYNSGRLLLTGSQLIANASGHGGHAGSAGIYGAAAGSATGGGAIYNSGEMTLMNSAFDHNVAGNGGDAGFNSLMGYFNGGNPGGAGGNGGAILDAGRNATFIGNCQFTSNASGAGGMGNTMGGVCLPHRGGDGGAGGGGGAIWAAVPLRISGCTFRFNQCGSGGIGGFGSDGAGGAGGMGGAGGAICTLSELTLMNCTCASNSASTGGNGGESVQTFAGAGGNGGQGGALYAGGTLRMSGGEFRGNLAGSGGQGGSTPTTSYFNPVAGAGGGGGSGGAVYCGSNLAATSCAFDSNRAGNAGPAGQQSYNAGFAGQPTVGGSEGGEGGGIFAAGPLVLRACTVSRNGGGNGSSGIPGSGPLVATNKTIVPQISAGASSVHPDIIDEFYQGKPGGAGGVGGIYSGKSLKMVLCTLSGDIGGAGGWGGDSSGGYSQFFTGAAGAPGGAGAVSFASSNELDLVACTIASNVGGTGGTGGRGDPDYSGHSGQGPGGPGGVGGVFKANDASIGNVLNTIVADDFGGVGGPGGPWRNSPIINGPPDLQGAFTSLGYNLIGQTNGSSGFINGTNGDLAGRQYASVDPVLGPLADNGGPTFTMALLHDSPALDAGDDALLSPPYSLKTDQRGFARKSGPHVDIGAFEYQYAQAGTNQSAHQPVVSGAFLSDGSAQPNADSAATALAAPAPARSFQLTFSETTPGATFSVLATTNLALPIENWSVVGQPIQTGPGQYQFTDVDSANNPQRYYRVSSP